jgi:hypothetical protein
MSEISKNTWEVTLLDAGDDSGDLILPFPDDLLEKMSWKEGDELNLYVDVAGRLTIRKFPK